MTSAVRTAVTASGRRRKGANVDGVLLLDKPEGPSSNQVLQQAKRLFDATKAGHAGTLDPFASGLLVIAFGEATKFCGYLLDAEKAYTTTLTVGVKTSTGDLTGDVVMRRAVHVTRTQVDTIVRSFRGNSLQTPPMYSAIKRDGIPLYKLARRGETVVREPRAIVISELQVLRFAEDEIDLHVRCSKGTYIRVLGEDIGEALGCGATLKRLRRTEVASFNVATANTLERLAQMSGDELATALLPPDAGLAYMPRVDCDPASAARLRLGQSVPGLAAGFDTVPHVRVYHTENHEFMGLARIVDGNLHPIRLIVPASAKIA